MEAQVFTKSVFDAAECLKSTGLKQLDARAELMREYGCIVSPESELTERFRVQSGIGTRVLTDSTQFIAVAEGFSDWRNAIRRSSDMYRRKGTRGTIDRSDQSDRQLSPQAECDTNLLEWRPLTPKCISDELNRTASRFANCISIKAKYSVRAGLRAFINGEGVVRIRPEQKASLALSFVVRSDDDRHVLLSAFGGTVDSLDPRRALESELSTLSEARHSLIGSKSFRPIISTVVLAPRCAALLLHEAIGHPSEADRIPVGQLRNFPVGVRVAIDELEVTDYGDVPRLSGSIPFDDEGTSVKPAKLVDRGRWVGLLHSRVTATRFHVHPTGNARSTSYRDTPICRMRVLTVAPSKYTRDELIASAHDGVFMDFPYGGHLRASTLSFTAMVAYRIRNGSIAEPLHGVTLIARPVSILKHIEAIGSDITVCEGAGWCTRGEQQDLPVSGVSPSILLRNVQLSARFT